MWRVRSFRGVAVRLIDREFAGHRGAPADNGIDAHLAAMELDKGAHQRQAKPGAPMARSVGVTLNPVKSLVLALGRNPRPATAPRDPPAAVGAPCGARHRRI